MPLGLLPIASYTADEVTLQPDDTVVIYTDGITEAENPEEEEYGEERLEAICVRRRAEPPHQLASAIEDDLDRFVQGVPFADDRTLVVIRSQPGEV
jgi:sigma-B regulation protein RsbU (phosphoserine phosphatase)